ncbi:MAG: DUF4214 domain-containing protein [Pseudomonadota bacterium]
MATVAEQIQKVYIGLLGRAADQAGLDYWTDEIESGALTLEQLRANIVEEQDEYDKGIGDMSRAQAVNQLYQNLFNRSAEDEGLDYWVNGGGADVSFDQLVMALVDGASAADTLALDNKAQVAEYYTAQAGEDYAPAAARAAVDDVDGDTDMADARADVDARIEQGTPNPTLTQQADNLRGTDGDDVFVAPVTQNETGSGELANTFETGDVINGGEGQDALRADLIATGAIGLGGFQSPAISAETTSVEEVYFRAQNAQGLDLGSNTTATSFVDAEKMQGVEQWWTENSRANIRIEDVRSRADDVTVGMRDTDPGVGYQLYFNPLFMEGDVTETESALTLTIQEITDGQAPGATQLDNISVREINFSLGGEDFTLSSDAMSAAETWGELQTAIADQLGENGLAGVTVEHRGNGVFVLEDENSGTFEVSDGEALIFGAASDIDVRNRAEVGEPVVIEGQTSTNIVLDGVGAGSRGGSLNVAAMSGDRGVEVFNVEVGADSHLTSLSSVNSPNTNGRSFDSENQLEEVKIEHQEGASGALKIGSRTETAMGVSTSTDDRLQTNGLTDVRVFDASGFESELMVGASLTNEVFNKYLADAEETVPFSYLLGDGGSNLSLMVNNAVAADPDFSLEIIGGGSDDRINLSGLQFKNTTSIDGDGGSNVVEVNTTTGAATANNTAGENSWAGFENIETLVVAGSNVTTQNLVVGNMEGLDDVVVATTGGVDTTMQQMRMDQDLTISGKNQTLGDNNSNNGQNFGTINVDATSAVPGVDSFGITLDNTARVDEELTVNQLNVRDLGNLQSDIRTLDLSSEGRRDTTNLIQAASLARVNTVNLDGSQDLGLHISAMQVNAQGNSTDSTVDGSELGGDLDLAMSADILNGATDVVTGTAGNDRLYVYGTDAEATVNGVETVDLGLGGADMPAFANPANGTGAFGGTFNAAAVSDVEQYNVQTTDDDTTLENLDGSEVINVNTAGADNDLTLVASDRAASNEIDVNFSMADNGWANGANTLSVQDYNTVNLDLTEGDYEFALDLETAGSDTYARTLSITGGTDDAADTSLDIGALDTALTRVDLSDYTGSLVGGEWDDTAGSNARVVMNEFDFTFDVGGDIAAGPASEFITTFEVSRDAAEGEVWTIDNFQAFDDTDITVTTNNVSVLDFSELGFTGLSDVNTDDDNSGNAVITANEDSFNFEIVLNGVDVAELNNENFQFA